jgi:hypothetical protein
MSIYLSDNNPVVKEFLRSVVQAIEEGKESLSRGFNVDCLEDYKFRIGRLEGLRMSLELFEYAETEVAKRDKRA